MKKHPCVIQVGFAGARNLYEGLDLGREERDPDSLVLNELKQILEKDGYIWNKLGLQDHHFFSGVSQMAIGGDFLFSKACGEVTNKIPHQVVLPLHRRGFLNDRSESDDSPDFSDEQKEQAINLLDSSHVISELCVASSCSRHDRFEEVNLHILRVSSIIIGIYPETKIGRSGGTRELLEAAKRQGRYVLEIILKTNNGALEITSEWHDDRVSGSIAEQHRLSKDLDSYEPTQPIVHTKSFPLLQDLRTYIESIKTESSKRSKEEKDVFKDAASWILGLHVTATILATIGLIAHYCWKGWVYENHLNTIYYIVIWLAVVFELAALLLGVRRHHRLHHDQTTSKWSQNRVIAELSRSIRDGILSSRSDMRYLFSLPFDKDLRSFLKTIYVLNLLRLNEESTNELEKSKEKYLAQRLEHNSYQGQIEYHHRESKDKQSLFERQNKRFNFFSGLAIVAVSIELMILIFNVHIATWPLSFFAIVSPVIAVALLSWAHILDSEGRHQSHEQTEEMAEVMAERIRNAESEMEFIQLVDITERRLLMETLEWESRTKNKGVA